MKPTELRIGNVFRDKVTGDIFPVLSLSKNKIVFDYVNFVWWQAEPIPITEEWLLKLGLWKDGDKSGLFSIPKDIIKKCEGDNGFKRSSFFFNDRLKRWMDCQTRVCVDYVHEVQNLVFALTGEELIYET